MSEVGGGFSDGRLGWQGRGKHKWAPSETKTPPFGRSRGTPKGGAAVSRLRSAPAEQAGEEARLFHRQDRTVFHVTQARIAVGTRHGPAVGATAAKALARHGDCSFERTRLSLKMPGWARGFPGGAAFGGAVSRVDHTGGASALGSRFREIFSPWRVWQEWRDSNPRPSVLETDALPTELHSCSRRASIDARFPWQAARPGPLRTERCT